MQACCDYDIENKDPDLFSPDQIEAYIAGIYAGYVTINNLDRGIYYKIADYIENAIYKGYGKTLFDLAYNEVDYIMLKALRENGYFFSAAKLYQQTRAIGQLLTTGERLRPFAEFKKLALGIFKTYNVNYLKTEYNLAVGSARMASLWVEIEKDADIFPFLQYETVGDARVRNEHKALDGVIRPVTDRFWGNWYPPNDFNCRCTVKQLTEGKVTPLKDLDLPEKPDGFNMNVGKEKKIFSPKHPYFKVDENDIDLARVNFNLPIPPVEGGENG